MEYGSLPLDSVDVNHIAYYYVITQADRTAYSNLRNQNATAQESSINEALLDISEAQEDIEGNTSITDALDQKVKVPCNASINFKLDDGSFDVEQENDFDDRSFIEKASDRVIEKNRLNSKVAGGSWTKFNENWGRQLKCGSLNCHILHLDPNIIKN